jgi:hypothetical protein
MTRSTKEDYVGASRFSSYVFNSLLPVHYFDTLGEAAVLRDFNHAQATILWRSRSRLSSALFSKQSQRSVSWKFGAGDRNLGQSGQ